jgi:hypothetical protein
LKKFLFGISSKRSNGRREGRAVARLSVTPHEKSFMNKIPLKSFPNIFSLIRADGAGGAATSALA